MIIFKVRLHLVKKSSPCSGSKRMVYYHNSFSYAISED